MSARNEAKERLMNDLGTMSDDEFEARCKRMTDEINARHKKSHAPQSMLPCTWRNDEERWESTCGLSWWLVDGTPAENDMNFCPKCGGCITEVTP